MKIEPGKTDKAKLRFRVRPTAADKYNAVSVVDFRSNDPTDPKVDIVLRVKEPLYPNYIAIDYGTSTSTAAYCDDTAKLLALEETDTKVASDVFFVGRREGEDPPYDYCIGRETEGLGVESYRRRATAAKVRVTETEPYEVEFDQRGFPVMPAEVARMGVLELVRFARSALGRRPSGIMFTVPTRFTLRQREALERVFRRVTSEKGLADTDVRFVDEAFAAGFYYLSEGIQADKDLCCCPIYTLMVIDVGGGTTDVTLFRVEQDPGSETTPPNIKKLEVLGAWGDQHLGGHALTMKVAEHLARQAGVAGDARPFEQTAERLKLAVSEYAKTLDDTRDGLVPADGGMLGKALLSLANRSVESLRKTPEPKRDWLDKQLKDMKNSRKVTVSLPSELGGSDLRAGIGETRELLVGGFDIFSAEVREILARCGIQRADKLLLCGQSSLLPDLPRSFKGLAAKFDYVRDPRSPNKKALLLKECVALGAALYANFRFRMTFEGRDKFWRILGTRDQGRFNALVPWGTTYPFETTCEFDRRFDVRQPGGAEQILQFNLWENLTLLPGRMQTDVYETFEIGIDGSKEDMFEGKVSLTREGQVEVYCRLGGAWQKMKPVGGQ
jgi:hypothetical protein